MEAIVTVCGGSFRMLFPRWLERLRRITDLPIFALLLEGTEVGPQPNCQAIPVNAAGNPFPPERYEHACAEKQRIFRHLPTEVSEVLCLDLDVLVLNDFWSVAGYFARSREVLVASPDLFVGYKEKMEGEFRLFDPSFRMKYLPDGQYYYFNTGVFFASREAHAYLFARCLETWARYAVTLGRYPSIFDQQIFNYCLIAFGASVEPMPIRNNCLRQYPKEIQNGRVFLEGAEVNAMHFNGGDANIKLARWIEFERALEESR